MLMSKNTWNDYRYLIFLLMKKLIFLLIPLLFLSSCSTKEETIEKPLVDSWSNFVYSPTWESRVCQLTDFTTIPSSCHEQDLFLFPANASWCLALPAKKEGIITVSRQLLGGDLPEGTLMSMSGRYSRNTGYAFHERNQWGETCLYLLKDASAKDFKVHYVPYTGSSNWWIFYGTDLKNIYISIDSVKHDGILTEKEILKYIEDQLAQDEKAREIK